VTLADEFGNLIHIHPITFKRWQAINPIAISTTILLGDTPEDWITITAAAYLHLDDIDAIKLPAAKAAISRACDDGSLRYNQKTGHDRRLCPIGVDAWRLRRMKADLARDDGK
jgi:hypothetical protein